MVGSQFLVITILGGAGLFILMFWTLVRLRRIHPLLPNAIWGVGVTAFMIVDLWNHYYSNAITLGAFVVFFTAIEWVQVRYPGSWINRPIGQLVAERRAAKRARKV